MGKAKERGHAHWQDWALVVALAGFWALAQFLVLRGSFVEDSDSVTTFLQANDILHGNWLLSGWTGAPDNYYTLDVFLSVACQGLFGFSLSVLLFQSLITYGCLMVGAMRLSRTPGSAWWIGGALLFLFLGLLNEMSMHWIMFAGGHVITVSLCLFCFSLAACLVSGAGGAPRRAVWFAYGGLSFLALAGDPLYKYVGLLPIFAAAGLAAVRYGRWRALGKLLAVSMLALVAAKIMVNVLRAQGFHIVDLTSIQKSLASFDTIKDNLYTYARSLWILLGAGDKNLLWLGAPGWSGLAQGFLGLRLLAAVAAVGWTGKTLLTRKTVENPEVAFIDSVLLAGVGLDSAAYIFSTLPGDVDNLGTCRYLVPAMVYASILVVLRCGPALSSRWSAARPGMRLFAPVVFFASLAMFVPRILELSKGQPNAAGVQLEEYLEAKGLHSGLGGYWQSKTITVLSRQKVNVAGVAVDGNGKVTPFHWQSKENWYDAPVDFVVSDPSDLNFSIEAPAIKTFGLPHEIADVGPFHVLIWSRDIHGEMDRPDLDLDRPDLIKFPLDLLKLHRQSLAQGVTFNPDGSIVDELKYPNLKPIIFGPYIHLPAGHYRLTFILSASDVADADGLACDTTIRLGGKILASSQVSGRELKSRTTPASITLTFTCPDPQEVCEFRVWKVGGMKLTLLALTLDKD